MAGITPIIKPTNSGPCVGKVPALSGSGDGEYRHDDGVVSQQHRDQRPVSPWLNLVERFFTDLTGDGIRAGSFTSVDGLVRDINAYLTQCNTNPKPYLWRTEGAHILANVRAVSTGSESVFRRGHEV